MKNRTPRMLAGALLLLLGILLAYATRAPEALRRDPQRVPDVPVREFMYGSRA